MCVWGGGGGGGEGGALIFSSQPPSPRSSQGEGQRKREVDGGTQTQKF